MSNQIYRRLDVEKMGTGKKLRAGRQKEASSLLRCTRCVSRLFKSMFMSARRVRRPLQPPQNGRFPSCIVRECGMERGREPERKRVGRRKEGRREYTPIIEDVRMRLDREPATIARTDYRIDPPIISACSVFFVPFIFRALVQPQNARHEFYIHGMRSL